MSSRLLVRLIALTAVLGVGVSLALVPAQARTLAKPHAGSVYDWYPVASRYEFKGGVPRQFKKSGRGGYDTHNGMLELHADRDARLRSTWNLSARTGRWETRFRIAHEHGSSRRGADYTLKIALVPPKGTSHCGGQGITLLSYTPRKPHTAKFEIYTLPAHKFTKNVGSPRTIGNDEWHTVAVEIKPTRISFYLDAHVVAKEARPASRLDVPLRLRYSLVPVAHSVMRDTRLQLDWARYWTLRKSGSHQDQVRAAPSMKRHANPTAC